MRRLDGPGAAGGPGRACDPGEVEVHQQRFAVRPGNRYVRDVRRARSLPAVDQRIRYDRDQTPLPLGAPILWPEMVRNVQFTSRSDTGTFPNAWTASE